MFEKFDYTQRAADAFKRLVYESKALPDQRQPALKAVSRFEGYEWNPELMDRCANLLNLTGFHFDVDDVLQFEQPGQNKKLTALVVDVLLTRYTGVMDGGAEEPIYTIKEAAVYLGVSVETVKSYVYRDQTLKPIRFGRGRDVIFTREALDSFKKPELGRPKLTI